MEGNLINRDTVVSEWMDLQHTFMHEDIILLSFQKTRLSPLNLTVLSREDFEPSHVFSVHGHLPAGYPLLVTTDDDLSDYEENIGEIEQVSALCIRLEL